MSTIQLEGTAKTPHIAFHDAPLSMEISGRSIPENSIAFYTPLLEWVDAVSYTHLTLPTIYSV